LEEESAKPKRKPKRKRFKGLASGLADEQMPTLLLLILTPLRQTPFVAFSVIKIGTFILTIGIQLSMAR
jgi:hypothetical protein